MHGACTPVWLLDSGWFVFCLHGGTGGTLRVAIICAPCRSRICWLLLFWPTPQEQAKTAEEQQVRNENYMRGNPLLRGNSSDNFGIQKRCGLLPCALDTAAHDHLLSQHDMCSTSSHSKLVHWHGLIPHVVLFLVVVVVVVGCCCSGGTTMSCSRTVHGTRKR